MTDIVVIDSRVADAQAWLQGLDPASFEWVTLSPDTDGLAQIASYLAGRSGLSAVHVVSIGMPGTLILGNTLLDVESIADHVDSLAALGASLAADGDLLLYGSKVGEGAEGSAFIDALASATGAGGDWQLEVASGIVEAEALDDAGLAAGDLGPQEGDADDNTLSGSSGDDVLRGLAGADFIDAGAGADILSGGDGDDVLLGGSGADRLFGGDGNDTASYAGNASAVTANLAAGSASDGSGANDALDSIENLIGSSYGDTLFGNAVANRLDGRAGDDTLMGGAGNDQLIGGSGFDQVWNGDHADSAGYTFTFDRVGATLSIAVNGADVSEVDTLSSIELISGTAHDDVFIDAVAGSAMYFSGWLGNDLIRGNAADLDHAVYSGLDASYQVHADLADGVVSISRSSDPGYAEVDTLVDIRGLWGSAGDDALLGNRLDNLLRGNAGSDLLDGRDGDDMADYRTSTAGVTIALAASGDTSVDDLLDGRGGVDVADYILATAGLSVTLAETGATSVDDQMGGTDTLLDIEGISGSAYADVLIGNAQDNFLRGRGGNDSLDGGDGNDTASYLTATSGVSADLASGSATDGEGGMDTLTSIENLNGGDLGDVLDGDGLANRLDGALGDDTLSGRGTDDTLIGGGGRDTLNGGAGDDTLDGGAITDRVAYRDVNIVSYAGASSGVVVNLASGTANDGDGGTDTLANLPFVVGSSHGDILTGSDPSILEQFEGGQGNDVIDGGAISDTLNLRNSNRVTYAHTGSAVVVDLATGSASGGDGSDTLVGIEALRGSTYDDVLVGSANTANGAMIENFIGNAGDDTLDGGAGHDRADYTSALGGVTARLGGSGAGSASDGWGGTDTLVSIEQVRGSQLYGDTLIGNEAANLLEGLGGNDRLEGGSGADTYKVDNSADVVNETLAGDVDVVMASVSFVLDANVDNLTLTGSAALGGTGNTLANLIIGNGAANTLNGGAGGDTLDGGLGKDVLTGGSGADTFRFDTALSASTNVDRISDFNSVDDRLMLDNAVFTKLGSTPGALASTAFWAGSAAHDSSDRIVYNAATGGLFYDSDGTGSASAVLFASVASGTTLMVADIWVV